MAPSLEELAAMTDAELRGHYNEIAKHTGVGLEWYREELRSRHLDRSERILRRLTCGSELGRRNTTGGPHDPA